VEAVRVRADLDLPLKDGTTLRGHYQAAERQTGKSFIDEPEIPPAGEHLWIWFWEINAGRGSTGWGPAPLSYQEIDAWARLSGCDLRPWEVRVLKSMDGAFLAAAAKKGER
jgi:hypothetical protein